MAMNVPAIGNRIYVPTIEQSFVGGLAKVTYIVGSEENHHVIVEEHDGANYSWERWLGPAQEELRKEFGNQVAYSTGIPFPCPINPKSDPE